jgi:hypothetical protein
VRFSRRDTASCVMRRFLATSTCVRWRAPGATPVASFPQLSVRQCETVFCCAAPGSILFVCCPGSSSFFLFPILHFLLHLFLRLFFGLDLRQVRVEAGVRLDDHLAVKFLHLSVAGTFQRIDMGSVQLRAESLQRQTDRAWLRLHGRHLPHPANLHGWP